MYKVFHKAIIFYIVIVLCFLITPFVIPISSYDKNDTSTSFNESKFAYIYNSKIHYRDFFPMGKVKGKVVLVHGFYGSTFSWQKNIFELVDKGYYVVALDLPGYGYSVKSRNIDHSLTQRTDILVKFLLYMEQEYEELSDLSWSAIGHSMGGGVVLNAAKFYSDLFKNIILVDPVVNIPRRGTLILEPTKRWLAFGIENGLLNKNVISSFLDSAYGRMPTDEEVNGYLLPLKESGTALSIADNISSSSEDSYIDLSSVKTSTLIIHGEKDTWVPLSNSDVLKSKLSTSDLKVIYGAYHCPQETHPAEFNDLVLGFI